MAFKTLKQGEQLDHTLVVDNSVMMRWLFQDGSDRDQDYAQGVLNAIGSKQLRVIVPYMWIYESAFVVEYYSRRDLKSFNECLQQLTWLFDLATVIRGEDTPASFYEFSHRQGLSACDAAYVMLAMNQACPIATLDKTIIKASGKVQYGIFEL
ncbi:MAG: type II toxin-antitoxin system VapC family toxin [Gammaproteobacteria bacterium]